MDLFRYIGQLLGGKPEEQKSPLGIPQGPAPAAPPPTTSEVAESVVALRKRLGPVAQVVPLDPKPEDELPTIRATHAEVKAPKLATVKDGFGRVVMDGTGDGAVLRVDPKKGIGKRYGRE